MSNNFVKNIFYDIICSQKIHEVSEDKSQMDYCHQIIFFVSALIISISHGTLNYLIGTAPIIITKITRYSKIIRQLIIRQLHKMRQ